MAHPQILAMPMTLFAEWTATISMVPAFPSNPRIAVRVAASPAARRATGLGTAVRVLAVVAGWTPGTAGAARVLPALATAAVRSATLPANAGAAVAIATTPTAGATAVVEGAAAGAVLVLVRAPDLARVRPDRGTGLAPGTGAGTAVPLLAPGNPTPKIPLRLDCLFPFYFISCGSELTTAYGQVAQAFEV